MELNALAVSLDYLLHMDQACNNKNPFKVKNDHNILMLKGNIDCKALNEWSSAL